MNRKKEEVIKLIINKIAESLIYSDYSLFIAVDIASIVPRIPSECLMGDPSSL